jgi:hypothetical protein
LQNSLQFCCWKVLSCRIYFKIWLCILCSAQTVANPDPKWCFPNFVIAPICQVALFQNPAAPRLPSDCYLVIAGLIRNPLTDGIITAY